MPSLSISISLSKAFLCKPLCVCARVCACVPSCVGARVRVCVCGLHNLFQHFCPPATSLYIMFCELIQSPKANFKKKDSLLLVLLEAKKRKKPLVVKSTSSKIPGPRLSSILKLACIEPLTLKTSTHSGWWLFSRSGQILTQGRNCFFRDLGWLIIWRTCFERIFKKVR